MTPKEITTLAGHRLVPPWVMKLALDVAAAEREECAKVCEARYNSPDFNNEAIECADAIRAKGE